MVWRSSSLHVTLRDLMSWVVLFLLHELGRCLRTFPISFPVLLLCWGQSLTLDRLKQQSSKPNSGKKLWRRLLGLRGGRALAPFRRWPRGVSQRSDSPGISLSAGLIHFLEMTSSSSNCKIKLKTVWLRKLLLFYSKKSTETKRYPINLFIL